VGILQFSKVKQRYRAEGCNGTTGFKNHLKSRHSVSRGQQQFKVGKDPGTEIVHV
jgi:hypothetical protein